MSLPTQAPPIPRTDLLRGAIFLLSGLFVILLPWSTKGARYAWIAAFCLGIVVLLVARKRLAPQPLALPMLAYIVLSGLSCVFSYEPYLSWPHMRLVCWTALIATLFAQTLRRLSRVRTLLLLLLLSATAVAGFTVWQYTRDIGLRIVSVVYGSPLHRAGLRPDDTLAAINGHALHSEADLIEAVSAVPPDATVRVRFLRSFPVRRKDTFARAGDFLSGSQITPTLVLAKARPLRAQGTLGHPGILAEVLAPIGCLAWALMLGANSRHRVRQALYAIMFLAIAATVFATQTRAALSALLLGCLIVLLFMASRRARLALIAGLILAAVGAVFWIQHTRGLRWVDARDAGTQYRVLMWKDGTRLALQHPFFGVGMDSIQNRWPDWQLQGFQRFHQYWNFHSDIVQLAAERGLLTLAAWLWFVAVYIVYLLRLMPRMRERTRYGWAVVNGILAGFVAFLLTSLVESSLGDDTLVMLLFFCCGVAIAMERMLTERGGIDVA